jgi:hypothetical protein
MVSVIRYLLTKIEISLSPYNTIKKMSAVNGNEEFTAEFFTMSSKIWLENKVHKGASLAYKCDGRLKNGGSCSRAAVMKDGLSERRCSQHKQRV